MSKHQLRAHEERQAPGRVRADSFFAAVMPVLLETRAAVAGAIGKRFAFDLPGTGGGAWTVDCGARKVERAIGQADVTVHMGARAFEQLLAGHLDIDGGVASGAIRIDGERRWLRALSHLLSPDPVPTTLMRTFDDLQPGAVS